VRRPIVPKVAVIVCDSWGVGGAPDASAYGDEGSDTLGHAAAAAGGIAAPNLERMGLGMLTRIEGVEATAEAGTAHGRATERSAGKDSTTGHWEMMGIRLEEPFPLYPEGFPPEVIEPFEAAIGRRVLGNVAASGTEILEALGEEHLATGRPIVYTSGDSVFQVAAHVDRVGLPLLYEWCRVARRILDGPHRVGRVIARPFEGSPGAFVRRPERRDYSVPPPAPTVLDAVHDAHLDVYGVGKIGDIFDGRGISEAFRSESNDHGVDLTVELLARPGPALVFTNSIRSTATATTRPGTRRRSRPSIVGCPRSRPPSTAGSCSSPATTAAIPRGPRPTTRASGRPCSPRAWRAGRSTSAPADRSATWGGPSPTCSASRPAVWKGRASPRRSGSRDGGRRAR
jgi:phosphopentomutase